jgi:hypothetical protein
MSKPEERYLILSMSIMFGLMFVLGAIFVSDVADEHNRIIQILNQLIACSRCEQ